jgi:homoaconitase/3-isopropylmalate dehydratase large subunit
MGMTMAEKILGRTSGLGGVEAGQYVTAKVDCMMAHEAFAMCALTLMEMSRGQIFV